MLLPTDKTYWTGRSWSSRRKDARVYKTMRVRDVCEKLQARVFCPLVCINLDNGKCFY